MDEFSGHMKRVQPSISQVNLTRIWGKFRNFFQTGNNDLKEIENHIDTKALCHAFQVESGPKKKPRATSRITSRTASTSSAPSRSRGAPSGARGGRSRAAGTSQGVSSNEQARKIRNLFTHNFDEFKGDPWTLPSGDTFDQLLFDHIKSLRYETALHSFVVDDVEQVLELARDEDRQTLEDRLEKRKGDEDKLLPPLSEEEVRFLQLYQHTAEVLREKLATDGYRTFANSLTKKPQEDFQEIVHDSITHLLRVYRANEMRLPEAPKESWYASILWSFLNNVFEKTDSIKYSPVDEFSKGSEHRRNRMRTRDVRQFSGHKTDGLVVETSRKMEICVIEISRTTHEPRSTKTLDDRLKLVKMMKDTHDLIRERTTQNVRSLLVTFGVLVSGRTITLFSMHQRSGRFYQLCEEESPIDLPMKWSTEDVLGVLARLLRFRMAMVNMANKVMSWLTISMVGAKPGATGDSMAATLTSPQLIPTQSNDMEIEEGIEEGIEEETEEEEM